MSVVIAIKKNDRIYMAADTQTSCGDKKITYLGEDNRKIHRFENGILLGCTGSVHNWQIICAHPEYFTVPESGEFNKKYVVQNIIPKILKCYKENDMCDKEEREPPRLGESYILAYKDKMFLIESTFDVEVLNHYAEIGSGGDFTLAGLIKLDSEKECDTEVIESRLIDILRIASSHVMSASGPYFLIDTLEQSFKLVH